MSELVKQLMTIRKDWTSGDFIEAYEDEWEEMPDNLHAKFDKMEEYIFHTYSSDFLKEVIENESKNYKK